VSTTNNSTTVADSTTNNSTTVADSTTTAPSSPAQNLVYPLVTGDTGGMTVSIGKQTILSGMPPDADANKSILRFDDMLHQMWRKQHATMPLQVTILDNSNGASAADTRPPPYPGVTPTEAQATAEGDIAEILSTGNFWVSSDSTP
jgi:hypothetical protein